MIGRRASSSSASEMQFTLRRLCKKLLLTHQNDFRVWFDPSSNHKVRSRQLRAQNPSKVASLQLKMISIASCAKSHSCKRVLGMVCHQAPKLLVGMVWPCQPRSGKPGNSTQSTRGTPITGIHIHMTDLSVIKKQTKGCFPRKTTKLNLASAVLLSLASFPRVWFATKFLLASNHRKETSRGDSTNQHNLHPYVITCFPREKTPMPPSAKRAACDASSPRNGSKRGDKKPEKEREARKRSYDKPEKKKEASAITHGPFPARGGNCNCRGFASVSQSSGYRFERWRADCGACGRQKTKQFFGTPTPK